EEEAPAAPEAPATPARDDRDIFAFPRGARAGTCLHEIFEHLDFLQTRTEAITPLIRGALRKHRFDDRWAPAVAGMVGRVVRLALDPEDREGGSGTLGGNGGEDGILTLSAVPAARRINEMGFYFPLKTLSGRSLGSVFAGHGITGPSGDFPERIGRLELSRTGGMMKGFIDLVFAHGGRYYIVDWKSNHLGDRPEDYGQAALDTVMADSFYILQYHLYALALHRYLKHRLPGYDYDAHFGGVRYLFLRGIDPEKDPSFGMFKDRPRAAVIRSLEALLVDTPADEG
ncbi:PD-(D/E)XK nuclease family protein, partial [Desulfococcus sp.]|uniref:PD-(D/E)XK nuclease family protein n=1 Tax=Desulfococcus sp. TaxID=2025834 RepID=UPI003593E70E